VKSALLQRTQEKSLEIEKELEQMKASMEELGTGLQEIGQQLQQVVQETKSNDDETMQVIDELAGAIEKIGGDILQTQQENDKIRQEKEAEEQQNNLRSESYNSGYKDAEQLLNETQGETSITEGLGEESDANLGLPPDLLDGIEDMSDDELAVLLESNPELAELLE
jgi:methyl-accepting chemotaxis protein